MALARAAKRVPLDNANQPAEPSLSEADRADMEVFLGHMLGLLPVLGVHAFEQARRLMSITVAQPARVDAVADFLTAQASEAVVLFCTGKGFEARGSDAAQGFVVFAGSKVSASTGTSLTGNLGLLRKDLLTAGVLKVDGSLLCFTQDYVFSSPSTAAALVLGRSANGRIEWKDAQGRTLKALQEAEASS